MRIKRVKNEHFSRKSSVKCMRSGVLQSCAEFILEPRHRAIQQRQHSLREVKGTTYQPSQGADTVCFLTSALSVKVMSLNQAGVNAAVIVTLSRQPNALSNSGHTSPNPPIVI